MSSLRRLEFLPDSCWDRDWSPVVLEAPVEPSFCFSAKGSKSGSKAWGALASLEPVGFFFVRKAFHHGTLSVIFDWRLETGTGSTSIQYSDVLCNKVIVLLRGHHLFTCSELM